MYNLFRDFLHDIDGDEVEQNEVFKNSRIWSKMYDFQRDAAISIINKLEKYQGCILADSVGLGKTFTRIGCDKIL